MTNYKCNHSKDLEGLGYAECLAVKCPFGDYQRTENGFNYCSKGGVIENGKESLIDATEIKIEEIGTAEIIKNLVART